MKKELNDNDYSRKYRAMGANGELRYEAEGDDTLMDLCTVLYDANGKKIGYVKEDLVPTKVPLFEKNVHKCSVFLGKDKIARLKKYVSFGDLSLDVLEGDVKIKDNKTYLYIYLFFFREIQIIKDLNFTST